MAITDNNRELCPLSYQNARAYGFRIESDLIIFRNAQSNLKLDKWSFMEGKEKNQVKNALEKYKFFVDKFPVFLPYYHLYNGIFIYIKDREKGKWREELEKSRKIADERKNTAAFHIIKRTCEYYMDDKPGDVYDWPARIIYSGQYEAEERQNKELYFIIPKI